MSAVPDAADGEASLSVGRFLCATVAYDGTDFCGFQVQVGQRTVQGVLEETLNQLTQETIRVTGSGRTDSGVHAQGQVIAFHTGWKHALESLHLGWNTVLPQDVAILSLADAKEGFHPRFSARSRAYRYTIWNQPIRNPLSRRTAYWVSRPLEVNRMAEAAQALVGEHDFATFGQPTQGTSTVRSVFRAVWTQDRDLLFFDIEANAFLHRMVRSIVGTLLQVGRGELSVNEFAARLAAADRTLAGPTAPANGLCLMAVHY